MSNYNTVCRACLSSMESFQYYLFDNVLPDMYWFCTSIEVTQEETMSKAICNSCYDLLSRFTEFKNTCIQSHKILSSEIKRTNTQDDFQKLKKFENVSVKQELLEDNYLDNSYCKSDSSLADITVKFDIDDENNIESVVSDQESKNVVEPLKQSRKIKIRKRSKLKLIEIGKKLVCDICNRRFLSPKRLRTHVLTHEDKAKMTRLKCTPCNKTFLTGCGLTRHNTTWHSIISLKRLKCKICGKVAKSRDSLKSHEKLHSDRQFHICNICGKAYSTKCGLKTHLETHQENRERQCTCEYCGKKFFTKKTLSSHVSRCHTGRRFICQICNYPFTDKYNLSQHLLIHEGKKLYNCKVCEKSFTKRFSFEEHQRIHSGERPFSCSYCQKSFLSKKRLTEHILTHTGEKPHKCSVCARGFTQRGTLKRHMKIHDKIIPVTNGKYIEARV